MQRRDRCLTNVIGIRSQHPVCFRISAVFELLWKAKIVEYYDNVRLIGPVTTFVVINASLAKFKIKVQVFHFQIEPHQTHDLLQGLDHAIASDFFLLLFHQ
ncbi:hypothetical protein WH96_19475 [Kiloniella spongiae]|uniref:Uncharacterized protein n=1 Tax=Kiloniella spongiae TaxID=1489064 RepID=A0A0H2M9Q4_9PROT|nr:hypothetical protein WH96_19475 [Kiloniella spongiae]